jgi:SAM-dependent methyltransferase
VMDLGRQLARLEPTKAERAYDNLTRYRFAQRYVEGKSVALISCEDVGYGDQLLIESSESVVRIPSSPESFGGVVQAAATLPPPSSADEQFDVVVAFEAVEYLEDPEALVREAKRVLKREGLLVISAPDKQAYYNERNYEDPAHKTKMYVSEFRKMLERQFARVLVYRQGAVAGGLIYEDSGDLSAVAVDSASFVSDKPRFSLEPPADHFVIAVCSDVQILDLEDERAYLLLDRDRSLLDECDEYREDIRLLLDEIRQMQETEVQAFRDALILRNRERTFLESQLERVAHSEAEMERLRARNSTLEEYVSSIERSRTWRALGIYRSLRHKLNALLRV